MEDARYRAHLHRGGMGLPEMRRLLEAFAQHGDIEQLAMQALQENLLGKTSEAMGRDALGAFRRRFIRARDLPATPIIAQVMCSVISDVAKNQMLLPFFVHTDPLAERCYRDLYQARMDSGDGGLSSPEVADHLRRLGHDHPELTKWSDHTRKRWSRGFIALLRSFSLVEDAPSTQLRRLWLLPEPFAFYWYWFWQQEGSYWVVKQHSLWSLFQLRDDGMARLLADGLHRRWWHYQRSGDIVEFRPRYTSLQDWVQHGLAQRYSGAGA